MNYKESMKPLSKMAYILDDMNKALEKKTNKNPSKRYYLGASGIGDDCMDKLWYQFRHAADTHIDHVSQKRFEDGFHSEDVYIKRLEDAGYNILTEKDGRQFGFSDLGGWFRGHRDGKMFGVYIPDLGEAKFQFLSSDVVKTGDKTYDDAIWEHKSSAKWTDLNKAIAKYGEENALENWNRIYYCQAQLYMGYDDTKWHILTCASEGSRNESIVLTEFKPEVFKQVREKARIIITSDKPPQKLTENEFDYRCQYMCNAKDTCRKGKIPSPNCRNCAHITFIAEGSEPMASCAYHNNQVIADQNALTQYYQCHRFNPCFLKNYDVIKVDGADIIYMTKNNVEFANGASGYSSQMLYDMQETKPWEDETLNKMNSEFGPLEFSEEWKDGSSDSADTNN